MERRRLVFAAGAIQRIFVTAVGYPGTQAAVFARTLPRERDDRSGSVRREVFQQRRAVQAVAKTLCQG